MARSLLLAQNTWDLTVDAHGNIALADDPYATAQNIACACRVFQGEAWYNTTLGLPYFQQILGKLPSAEFLKQLYINVAESVPDVASATVYFTSFSKRELAGQIQAKLTSGATVTVQASNFQGTAPWYVTAASPQALSSPTGGP